MKVICFLSFTCISSTIYQCWAWVLLYEEVQGNPLRWPMWTGGSSSTSFKPLTTKGFLNKYFEVYFKVLQHYRLVSTFLVTILHFASIQCINLAWYGKVPVFHNSTSLRIFCMFIRSKFVLLPKVSQESRPMRVFLALPGVPLCSHAVTKQNFVHGCLVLCHQA